jgi:LDH2 family malate/lactate/ureidoglycolate dehydrogenase
MINRRQLAKNASLALGAGILKCAEFLWSGARQQDRKISSTDTRNVPPTDGIKVAAGDLRNFVASIFKKVPIAEDHALLIAELLVDTDLRGVVSHGVVQVDRYVRSYQQGKTNTQPKVSVLQEGPVTTAFAGDGGLGMIVATRAMQKAIQMAKQMGVGVTTSTYHAHLGSTGKYVRMAMRENLIGISFSGRNAAPHYDAESTILGSIQGSPPLSFGMPSGPNHPPFLLDMASHIPWDEEFFKKMPQVYFKAIGLSHVANIMSGTLSGQMLVTFEPQKIKYKDADQSGFFMALDIQRFVPLQAFKADMDHLMDEISRMKPLPGFRSADLPGGPEWKKEKAYLKEGIPISAEAQRSLETLASEFHLPVPWRVG